eukprot:TRINITY_DN1446_c0_g1_i1.p1 TRINITY_DN1446_c0_g1~~TRINITY_DN1446_c0_g1_i1.p1  ORF type:complete len:359 (-),score=49.96 TRINITY_DN1446_c0_g1_i1:65-1141(-)
MNMSYQNMSSDPTPSPAPDFDDINYRRQVGGYQYDVYVPTLWVLLFLSAFTLATTYSFSQQRRFPACVASWSVMLTMVKCMRELFKWGDYSRLHYYLVWHPTQKICATGFAADIFFDSGYSINNLILTFIIFMTVKRGVDVSKNANINWHKVCLVVFWVYTSAWTIGAASLRGFIPKPPICPSADQGPQFNFAFLCFYFLFVISEIFLLGSSAKYIYSVFHKAEGMIVGPNSSKSNDTRLMITTVRFLAIIVLQTVPGVLFETYHLLAVFGHWGPVRLVHVAEAYLTWVFIAGAIECLIIIALNRDLMRWIKSKYLKYTGKGEMSSEKSSGSEDKQQNDDDGAEQGGLSIELRTSGAA